MAGFKAEGIVDPLDYSLRPYVDEAGTIQEPSSAQVRAYITAAQKEIRRLSAKAPDIDPEASGLSAGVAAVLEAMAFRGESYAPEALKRQADMLSALCSGTPSAESLLELPHRIMLAFASWAAGEVLDPEAEAGAGNAQVTTLPSSAAG